jgi:hypothetical protein
MAGWNGRPVISDLFTPFAPPVALPSLSFVSLVRTLQCSASGELAKHNPRKAGA